MVQKVWKQFCENTSLHGWAYIAATDKWILRMVWFSVISVGFTWAAIYVTEAIVSWDEQETITTIKNFSTSIREIQFPTITVCPIGWDNDRWGFLRAFLDEIEFPCDYERDEQCIEILDDINLLLTGYKKFMLKLFDNIFYSDTYTMYKTNSQALNLFVTSDVPPDIQSSIKTAIKLEGMSIDKLIDSVAEAMIGNRTAFQVLLRYNSGT